MSQELDVSILIPVYNEEQAIKGIIDQVNAVMQKEKYSYEILIVDDASDDKTREEVAKTSARLVRRSSRGGAGAARKTGIRAALGKIVVMLDGDGSYEINDIPKMLAFFP